MALLLYLIGAVLIGLAVRWWRPQPGWRALAVYALLAAAFFAVPLTTPAVQVPTDIVYLVRPFQEMLAAPIEPANRELIDVPSQMIPFRALVRNRLLHGEAPLWANEMGTGGPLLGDASSAPFSPLGLLTLPLPAVRSLPVTAALRLLLSLALTDALLSALGAGRAGAAFGALAYTFSVFSIGWGYHPQSMTMAWVPGVLLGLTLLRRGERGGFAGLIVCATGAALSGHPETLAHSALGIAAVGVALLALPGGAPRPRYLLRAAAAALLAAGLAAPALLPVIEAIPEGVRSEMLRRNPDLLRPPNFAAGQLRVLVDPLVFGSPRYGGYHGPLNYIELCSGYAGGLALALALAAALACRGRYLAMLAGGAAAAAAAFAVPPFLQLVTALPLYDRATNGRLRLLWVLALAIGAGLGLEPLAASRRGRWTAAACCAAAGVALALVAPPASPWQRAWWLATLAGFAATAAAFAWRAARPATRPHQPIAPAGLLDTGGGTAADWLPWLAVACLALDLGLLNGRFLPVLPPELDLSPPPALQAILSDQRVPFRVIGSHYDLLPNLASVYGLWDPRGNDPMQPAQAALVVGMAFHPRPGQILDAVHPPYPVAFLSYLGVRYMLGAHGEELAAPWERAWDLQGGTVWRNRAALPLFFMPATWRPARDPADALRATLANVDFAAAAVTEPPGGAAAGPGGAAPGAGGEPGPRSQRGSVQIASLKPNSFDLDVATPTGGLAVSSVALCRGWHLTLDGRPAGLVRVNGAFIGFLTPPGTHHAVLAYRPAGWVWGLRLCGLALLGLAAITASSVIARHRPLGAPGLWFVWKTAAR